MRSTLPGEALNQIFREARTHGAWLDKPVEMRLSILKDSRRESFEGAPTVTP